MSIDFRFKALSKETFQRLLKLNEEELANVNATWLTVDSSPGYPCRVSLEDARIGERVLAYSFFHHDVDSPYRASGPIFVREHAKMVVPKVNEVPEMFRHRLLSIRAYDSSNMMIGAEVSEGQKLEDAIENQLKNSNVKYIHIHNANPGCFNCVVYRT